jgi:hypothetical protein
VVRNDAGDVAVLAISPSDLVSRSNYSGPYRSCGSLRDRLELEGPFTFCSELFIYPVSQRLQLGNFHVAGQLGLYASWMHSRSAHATIPVPFVESNGEENVRRLRSAVCDEGLVGRTLWEYRDNRDYGSRLEFPLGRPAELECRVERQRNRQSDGSGGLRDIGGRVFRRTTDRLQQHGTIGLGRSA